MAGYRDELERLNFSAEEKEALTCRLLERRSGQEEKRPRFPYRGLVAIVAAASLLTGAVGAVSLAGVSPAFRELFGITSEEKSRVQHAAMQRNCSTRPDREREPVVIIDERRKERAP